MHIDLCPGKRPDLGLDLHIAELMIAHGMRERVNELISIELGPVTELDLQRHHQSDE